MSTLNVYETIQEFKILSEHIRNILLNGIINNAVSLTTYN